jgi:aminoglycoside/choline kinase family phosphotransferase
MLMDAPGKGEDPPCPPDATEPERRALGWNATSRLAASRVDAFIAIARHLQALGLSAPHVIAADPESGLALLEDFGDGLYARLLADAQSAEADLYAHAGALLARVQAAPVPPALPVAETASHWPLLPFDALAMRANIDLFVDWLPRYQGKPAIEDANRAHWNAARDALVEDLAATPHALTLRDFHAENLIWLPERDGLARVGLLDFQDAVIAPRAWDLSMLLHDARRDVSPQGHHAALRAYTDASGADMATLNAELARAGLANTLRILGIFARLVHRDGKARYADFMPREWGHLRAILREPAARAHSDLLRLGGVDVQELLS